MLFYTAMFPIFVSSFKVTKNKKMNIQLSKPYIESKTDWREKQQGVIFIDDFSKIDIVRQYLIEQDDYWTDDRGIIQFKPESVSGELELMQYCEYIGKRSIYDVPKFISDMEKEGIGVFVWWYLPDIDDMSFR